MTLRPVSRSVLVGVLLAPLCACGRDYDVASRTEAGGPALIEDCRFERSRQLVPRPVRDTNGRIVHTHRATFRGRRFHFQSKRGGSRAAPFRSLHVSQEGSPGSQREIMRTTEDTYGYSLAFEVAALDDSIVVIFATNQRLAQVIGRWGGRGLSFSPPEVIHKPRAKVVDLIAAASGDRVHVLWTEGGYSYESKLYHMSTADLLAGWGQRQLISQTAVGETANLVVDGDHVFLAWCDHRLRRVTPIDHWNYKKIFVTRSRDGGETFERSVLLSDAEDETDRANTLYLTPTGADDLALFWSGEIGRAEDVLWRSGRLDRELDALKMTNPVEGSRLIRAYRSRVGR